MILIVDVSWQEKYIYRQTNAKRGKMIRPTINITGFTFLSVITIDSGAKDDKILNSNPKEIFVEEIDASKYYLLSKRKIEKSLC